jgi:hypothetical protein
MADFAQNYTPRYRVNYRVGGNEHSFIWRVPRGTTRGDVTPYATRATLFLDALEDLRYASWTVLGAEWAEQDTDIFLPTTAPTPVAGASTEIGSSVAKFITQYRFESRSVGPAGARGSFSIFGLSLDIDDSIMSNFRVHGIENGTISTALGVLTEVGGPVLVCVDGATALWRPYVNVKINDHWVYEKRG